MNSLKMLDSRKPHFFQAFNPRLNKLKIPLNFVKHLKGITRGLVFLTGPSGNTWLAELVNQEDGLSIRLGWKEFVSDHKIVVGDSLVFRYDGDLKFTVQVFDRSTCEKEAAFDARCRHSLSGDEVNVVEKRGRGIESPVSEAEPKKMRTDLLEKDLKCATGSLIDVVVAAETQERIGFSEAVKKSESSFNGFKLHSEARVEKPGAVARGRTRKQDKYSSNSGGLEVSAREEAKVSKSFISPHPHFVRAMRDSNVSGSYTLDIPYAFSTAHSSKCEVQVTLQNLQGENWIVSSIPQNRVRSHTLCEGWKDFVQDNDIKVGDILIFELLGNFKMRVHILEDGKEKSCGRQPSMKLLHGSKSCNRFDGLVKREEGCVTEIVDQRASETSPLATLSNAMTKISFSQNSITDSLQFQSKSSDGKAGIVIQNETGEGGQQIPCNASSVLSMAAEVKRLVKTITLKSPYFVKIMTISNVSGYALTVPAQFATTHLLNCQGVVILRNSNGEKSWRVNSISQQRGHHTFHGGWMGFVRENNIKVGDICIFELVGMWEFHVYISGSWKGEVDS